MGGRSSEWSRCSVLYGGRLNRPGIEAVYLSLDVQTAINEFKGISTLLPPGMLVSYQINVTDIVDFRKGYQANKWTPLWESFYCDWRSLAFDEKIEPPSWVLGDQVIASGAKGIMFLSAYGYRGTNLVIYPHRLEATDIIEVIDPKGDLPKNQQAW